MRKALTPPQLGRVILNRLGRKLQEHYETRTAEPNPRLNTLAIILDAKLRNDPYLKGSCHEPSKQT